MKRGKAFTFLCQLPLLRSTPTQTRALTSHNHYFYLRICIWAGCSHGSLPRFHAAPVAVTLKAGTDLTVVGAKFL